MEQDRLAREAEEKAQIARSKKLQDSFADPKDQWKKDKGTKNSQVRQSIFNDDYRENWDQDNSRTFSTESSWRCCWAQCPIER